MKTQLTSYSMMKVESISLKIINNIRISTLANLSQHSFGSPSHDNQGVQRKGIQIGNEVILSVFADDITLCIENPRDTNRKLIQLFNEISKVVGYKINM